MLTHPAAATLPRHFMFWPEDVGATEPAKVQELYERGFAGAFKDDIGTAQFEAMITNSGGQLYGSSIMTHEGFAGSGAGRLVIPFRFVEQLLPGCWPGAGQQRGDCVSHSQKNANLITMCCDIVSGQVDEVTGKFEGLPEIDLEGIKHGALSTEALYWYRGYSGDGWSCDVAAKKSIENGGLWPRRNYPDLGVDLTKYSGALAGKYGRSAPPAEFTTAGRAHAMRTATRLQGAEQWRDFLANGYGITTCGGEGYSSTRDENGYSRRQGSWAHALACIGFDDRDVIKQKYGEALVLILNSWGRWNNGPRRILGTDIDIPEGSYWTKWSEVRNREALAMSGAMGWPAKKLPGFDLVVG